MKDSTNQLHEIICPYWVVNNQQEKQRVMDILKVKELTELNYRYPYVIGKERSFIFQEQSIKPIPDFDDLDRGRKYVYKRQHLD